MPARQPFTSLCQALARPRLAARADLHVHTTHSDGTYTPGQVVELARRSGLAAISITDHDSLDGIAPARRAAGAAMEVVCGVELTCCYRSHVLHLLGYFFRPDDSALAVVLNRLRQQRAGRFREMVERLRACGVSVRDEDLCAQAEPNTLSRRHLAEMLVHSGQAATIREAFTRYLGDRGRVAVPHVGLPVAEAIALVRGAGGVAAWAHPSYDCSRETLSELRSLGLDAVEAEYPGFRRGRVRELRDLAASLGLAITGGSDCHGSGNYRRDVGACGISTAQLDTLRELAACRG
jgi:predicted metal-dependent phosphoesterase TrpH